MQYSTDSNQFILKGSSDRQRLGVGGAECRRECSWGLLMSPKGPSYTKEGLQHEVRSLAAREMVRWSERQARNITETAEAEGGPDPRGHSH